MADILKVYKGDDVVVTGERQEDGKAKVTIDGLEANTDYPTGTYKVSFENENGESEKVDVPSFKTKPISVTGVTLSKESLTLEPGAKGSIEVTVQPSNATNKGVTFTSSNEAVATVDSKGEITAKTEGNADITVTTVDGGKTAKLKLTVKKAVVNVTGVKLDKTTLSLEEGATGNLVATVAPSTATDKTVTFASSDVAIATVDNTGKVTAVKPGAADITVTTKDGSKTAKCALTVTAKTIAVTGVTIAPKTASIDVGATTKLNSTVAPSNATNKSVAYASSDEAVATVSSNGTVTGVAEGDATITVTTQDGNKSDTATVTVNAAVINVTGVTVEPNTATLEVGDTQQLTPTVIPANASDKTVTYASKAQGIASVDDNGLITGKTEGATQIVVTTKDGNKNAVCDVTVNSPEPEPEPEVPEEPEESEE